MSTLTFLFTHILFEYSSILLTKEGNRRVQISSSIEEMIFMLRLEDKNIKSFDAFAMWLKNWKDEGFSEELYTKLRNYL